MCSCVASLSPREFAHKDERATKKLKVIILEVKFESYVNGVIEEISDYGNVDTATVTGSRCTTSDAKPQLSEDKLINTYEKGRRCTREDDTHKKLDI